MVMTHSYFTTTSQAEKFMDHLKNLFTSLLVEISTYTIVLMHMGGELEILMETILMVSMNRVRILSFNYFIYTEKIRLIVLKDRKIKWESNT